ncbi:hypothetical protein E3C22_11670 [Jiella endophytica]|uniref:PRC-barrel domain-containing protein n=1 Tax=Jiella endophytica TaxID=2558362 RepID=A0A4Y8RK37_9HYPH|nr:PRC-barrel domain-containing protein [Jiella endophytica]TFF23092.1 hypothetical protein E3C22_11670 [Jiella endophytica]
MIRKLLATTAIAALLTAPAMAQDSSSQPAQEPAATQSSGDMSGDMAKSGDQQQAAASGNYLTKLSSDQYLASNLTGQSVYDGEGEDAQSIGDIQNFLVGSDGTVVAAIVGATVNDESKTVAIPFQQIGWTMDKNNEPRAVLKASKEDLSSAPTFQTKEEQQAAQQQASSGGETAPADGSASAPAGGTTMAEGSAAAPASGDQMAASQPGDTASKPADGQSMASSDSNNMASGKTDRETATNEAGSTEYPSTVGSDQYLSENLIGANVYSGPGEDADDIGGINDLVLASSGKVEAAVVGVGGFLGIGEKEVALPLDQLQMSRDENDEPRITAALDKEALEKAPEFDSDKSSDQMAENSDAQSTDQQSGDQMAASTDAQSTDQQSNDQMAATTTGAATGAAAGAAANAGDQAEQTADNAGQAMDKAGDQAQQTAENTGQAMDNAGDQAQQNAENATEDQSGDATTTASTGGDQREGMTKVADDAQLTADDLMGTTVYGPNDQSVGEIGDIALKADGTVDAVIVDVGGFLGIGEKPIAVGMDNLNFMRDKDGKLYLYTQFTEDQLNNAPEYNKDAYAENRDKMRLDSGDATGSSMSSDQPADQKASQPAN